MVKPGRTLSESTSLATGTGITLTQLRCHPWQQVPKHAHEQCGFFVLFGGDIVTEQPHGCKEASPFDPEFSPANNEIELRIGPKGIVALTLEFSERWLHRMDLTQKTLGMPLPNDSSHSQLELLRLAIDFQQGSLTAADLESRVGELLGYWTEGGTPERNPLWLRKAGEHLREHFRSKVNLIDLAWEVGVHPVHLARVFREKRGGTINEHVKQLRLLEAHRLILEGMTLGEAAVHAGFCDQAQLARYYREAFGVAPKTAKLLRPLHRSA